VNNGLATILAEYNGDFIAASCPSIQMEVQVRTCFYGNNVAAPWLCGLAISCSAASAGVEILPWATPSGSDPNLDFTRTAFGAGTAKAYLQDDITCLGSGFQIKLLHFQIGTRKYMSFYSTECNDPPLFCQGLAGTTFVPYPGYAYPDGTALVAPITRETRRPFVLSWRVTGTTDDIFKTAFPDSDDDNVPPEFQLATIAERILERHRITPNDLVATATVACTRANMTDDWFEPCVIDYISEPTNKAAALANLGIFVDVVATVDDAMAAASNDTVTAQGIVSRRGAAPSRRGAATSREGAGRV